MSLSVQMDMVKAAYLNKTWFLVSGGKAGTDKRGLELFCASANQYWAITKFRFQGY